MNAKSQNGQQFIQIVSNLSNVCQIGGLSRGAAGDLSQRPCGSVTHRI